MRTRWMIVTLLGLTGCAMEQHKSADLHALYDRAAMSEDDGRNPVIVIPGILGSRLVEPESGTVVWGAYTGDFANPQTEDGARLISLPMREGARLSDLTDEVVPDGVLDRVKIQVVGLPIELSAYREILSTLGAGGYRDQELGTSGAIDYGGAHFTCFQFGYDWRRDCAENAAKLHEYIEEQRVFVAQERAERLGGEPDPESVKFDIVAHSMGGLIARYYLMYGAQPLPDDGGLPQVTWAGASRVDKAILVGTPNAGSAKSLVTLTRGVKYGPIVPGYESALLGTCPSIFQLLPRVRHQVVVEQDSGAPVDFMDPKTWEHYGWGLADPRQDRILQRLLPEVSDAGERRRIAQDHLQKSLSKAHQFAAALDQNAPTPAGLMLSLFAGDSEPTTGVLTVDSGGDIRERDFRPGDGTVTRASALMDDRLGNTWQRQLIGPVQWSSVMFLPRDHLGMTRDPLFADNVLFMLLESP